MMRISVNEKAEKYRIPLALAAAALGVYWTSVVNVVWEMSIYMTTGLNIYRGEGFTDISGAAETAAAPLLPLLLVPAYAVGGVTPEAAFWSVRLFAVAGIVGIYCLGRKVFGWPVALAGALFCLTSYALAFSVYRHVDGLAPVFLLAAFYFLWERKFPAAGVLLGFAALSHESALVFFLAPFILALLRKEPLKEPLRAGLIAVAVTLPWYLYAARLPDFSFLMPSAEGMTAFIGILTKNFLLAPLFPLVWFYALNMFERGKKEAALLLAGLVCALPSVMFLGNSQGHIGQAVFFYQLTYLALAAGLYDLGGRFLPKYKEGFFVLAAAAVIVAQFCLPNGQERKAADFFKRSEIYRQITNTPGTVHDDSFFVRSRYAEVVAYLQTVAKRDAVVMVENYPLARGFHFFLEGENKIFDLPLIFCGRQEYLDTPPPEDKDEIPAFLHAMTLHGFKEYVPAFLLYPSRLNESLSRIPTEETYIVLTGFLPDLRKYFDSHPAYQKIDYLKAVGSASRRESLLLYKVNITKIDIPVKTVVATRFVNEMTMAKEEDEAWYQQILADLTRCSGGNLTPEKIRKYVKK